MKNSFSHAIDKGCQFASLANAIAIALVLALSGCGFVHDEKIVGAYHLAATDTPQQMGVCYSLENGDCVGRIPETVFSIGWNDQFIVAKQHPSNDRSVTNYFILEIARDSKLATPSTSVIGPISATEFKNKVTSLGLPSFSKTIGALE